MEKNNFQELKERLIEQKEQIDKKLNAIEMVEHMLEGGIDDTEYHMDSKNMTFSKISQDDACEQFLEKAPTKIFTTKEIANGLQRGGYKFSTAKPHQSVAVTLRRMALENKIKKIEIKAHRVGYQALNSKGSDNKNSEPLNFGDVGERSKPSDL